MKKLWRLVPLMLLITPVISTLPAACAQDSPGVSDERFAHLARGINLPNWFWFGPGNPDWAENVYTDTDFELIHNLGFTYVRVPIDLNFLLLKSDPDMLSDEAIAVFDRVLQKMLDHDLAVVVDLHSTDQYNSNNMFSGKLEDNPEFIDTFEAFWASFAAHLSSTDPEWVFLEVLNEPVYENDTSLWPPVQARLVTTIRANAPEHTIIATSALWSNINTFIALEPFDDPNIIYNFHFYEPFVFTHQGAGWAGNEVARLHDIPYPSSPENVESIAQTLEQEIPADSGRDDIVRSVRQYGSEQWDIHKLDERVALAAQWSENHGGLRLMCNEFGAYSARSKAEDRALWLHDIRVTFEKYGVSWALWNYEEDGFGLIKNHAADPVMAEALGLEIPEE